MGKIVYGEPVSDDAKKKAKELIGQCKVNFSRLDETVDRYCTSLMMTVPNCLTKTIESLRKHKLQHFDRNRERNRAWLSLNMMTVGKTGFEAFNEGARGHREPNFITMRNLLAKRACWGDDFIEAIMPPRS